MSSTASIQFRCPGCQRLLSVSRSRSGSAVTCPRCQSSLIVPDAVGGEPTASPAQASSPSHAPARPARGLDTLSESGSSPSTPALAEPAFPSLVFDSEPLSLRPSDSKYARASNRAASKAAASTGSQTSVPTLDTPPSSVALPTVPIDGTRSPVPRTAQAAWAMVALAALALSFLAGLLAGHFVWRP